MALTRREACMLIPAMMTAARAFAADADRAGQTSGSSESPKSESPKSESPKLAVLPSKTYNFDDLHEVTGKDHHSYPILEGKTRTGFAIELHETSLAPGAQPHPPHRHPAEELFLVRDGVVDVTIDGNSSTLPGGSVAYIASNALHGIRNAGSDWARYFVMQLDVEKSA